MPFLNSSNSFALSSHHIGLSFEILDHSVVGTCEYSFSLIFMTPLSLASTYITKFLYTFSLMSSSILGVLMGLNVNLSDY